MVQILCKVRLTKLLSALSFKKHGSKDRERIILKITAQCQLKEMKKILILNTVGLDYDGITNVIYTYLSNMDLSDLQVYVAGAEEINPKIQKRFEDLSINVVQFVSRKKHMLRYLFSLINFIKKNKISVLHAHGNSATLTIEMIAGLLGGSKKRIAHTHSSNCESKLANLCLKPFFKLLFTDAIACGEKSGKFLFKKNFLILPNGRNIKKFVFDDQTRIIQREKYHLSNQPVFGHVGGFYDVKNHVFLLKVFSEISKIFNDAVFFMIGEGVLRESIIADAKRLDLNVIFTGNVSNVSDYLQMMDAMILPSKYEGFPLVALEWQINGLPIIMSDTIPNECVFMENVKSLSLNQSPQIWAREIINLLMHNDRNLNSQIASERIQDTCYNIDNSVALLRKLYLK